MKSKINRGKYYYRVWYVTKEDQKMQEAFFSDLATAEEFAKFFRGTINQFKVCLEEKYDAE